MGERLMLVVFPALALLSPLIETFGTLSIPAFTSPSLILLGTFGGLGLVLGACPAVLLPRRGSRFVRHALYAAALAGIALVVLDVTVGGHRLLTAIAATRAGRLVALVSIGCGLWAGFWMIRRHAAPLLFVSAAAFFLSSVALNPSVFAAVGGSAQVPAGSARTQQPLFVYIVLDEAMGVEGLENAPGGSALATQVRALFRRHGFRVHGGAFSRHVVSGRSIPTVLNFDVRDDSWGAHLAHSDDQKVRSALFEKLARDRYEVVSYATGHIDLCFSSASRCEVFPSFNPFSPYVENARLKSKALFQMLWREFVESYLLYRYFELLFSRTAPGIPAGHFDTYGFPQWFERFEAELTSSPRGRAYFAHLLMPHAPYVFDRSCRLTGNSVVSYFLLENRPLSEGDFEEARRTGYAAYVAQYECLLTWLEALLTRFHAVPRFRDATVVIHGDHGPRISRGQYAESLDERDLVDNYSALYAIRRPDIQPGYDTRLASIQRLTAEYFSGRDDLGPDDRTVAIDSKDGKTVVVRGMTGFASDLSNPSGGRTHAPPARPTLHEN